MKPSLLTKYGNKSIFFYQQSFSQAFRKTDFTKKLPQSPVDMTQDERTFSLSSIHIQMHPKHGMHRQIQFPSQPGARTDAQRALKFIEIEREMTMGCF